MRITAACRDRCAVFDVHKCPEGTAVAGFVGKRDTMISKRDRANSKRDTAN